MYMAAKITKMYFDGQVQGVSESGSATWDIINDVIDSYMDAAVVKTYLEDALCPLFASTPVIHDPRRLLQRLCCRPHARSLEQDYVALGTISVPYMSFG
jgi:hypothetical protein